ncbi:MAG: ABC transporter ATP-binding protein [Thermomicrobiales bacterium]|nr:ABC transporter ATP-binding protein [Thermomicrobiales bacterium]
MVSTDSPSPGSRLNWRLLTRYLAPLRWQVLLLAFILAATIGVQLALPLVTGMFIDRAIGSAPMQSLLVLAALTIALALLGQVVAVAETWVAERVSWSATNALREDLAAHLLHLDATFHHGVTPGELIERVDGDVGTLAGVFSRFTVSVIGNGLLMLGILVMLLALDWKIGLCLTVVMIVTMATLLIMRARATPLSAQERQVSADFYGFLGEYLAGLEDIRANGGGWFVIRRCTELLRGWLSARLGAEMRGYAMVAVGQGLFGLGMALALAVSAGLYRDGALTIGAVFLVFRYTDMLLWPADQIRNEIQDLQRAGASLGRIDGLLAERSRLVDGPGGALPPGPLSLELDDVWFSYEGDTPVLRGVSLHLPPQRVLGVMGRTGSGKTTLTRLLPRFYDPTSGAVRLGGVDLRDVSVAAVRARVGLVTQEAHLFHASVRDNLTLFDDAIADARLLEVLESVGLGPWVQSLPAGLDTILGAGVGLSAGQLQILACSRVLLRDPDLVILDEPSSKLDPVSERLVHRALGQLLAGRTGVLVAHRLSTFAYADDILILEDGAVREHGPRLELAADPSSRYAATLRLAAGAKEDASVNDIDLATAATEEGR